VEQGTARIAKIPGLNVCAKTGTAQNSRIIDGKPVELPDNSMFVCFAPKENPKIALAVTVENAGFGATWAGPIARILMEKYLNDTIQEMSKQDVERIAGTNLMPRWLTREQYKEDSIRAFQWFKMTKDSSYIQKYVFEEPVIPFSGNKEKEKKSVRQELIAIMINEKSLRKKNINPVV
jgi:penicillin-binding protein 2